MRFVGVRDGRTVTVARLFADGTLAPVAEVTDFYADPAGSLAAAAALTGGSVARAAVVEAPAVPPAARVLCVGLNYRMHADEAGMRVPEHPAIFGRWTASLTTSGVAAPVPAGEPGWDWEVELAAIVGRPLKGVTPAEALAGVLGYAAFNDLSARTHQLHSRLWTVGKNADASGPISEIVTADETGDPGDGWRLTTVVNGETVQDGTTADMVFGVGELLAYLSEVMTLRPGDVIATGTPDGVGFKRTPPRYLVAGDVVVASVDGVASVTTPIT
ncbi:fumarylacetoacetate hydrolase family protein [Nakamurella sp.]|uniref:fumarylacetoacetate hydrolase family protein n=1 Tax=Nakamurella sp. TaxID=1869182 RepID=UPI003B3A6444